MAVRVGGVLAGLVALHLILGSVGQAPPPTHSAAVATAAPVTPKVWHDANLSALPQAAQNLVQFQLTATDTLGEAVETDAGLTSWLGSDTVPGTISVAPEAHGASDVTWTVDAAAGSVLGHGPTRLVFWISQDGQYMRAVNANALFVKVSD